jgi:ADP-ribosyl-[dinitrogen reductase] hydrolase
MLVEMAVADAYAIPFEFTPHTEDRPNDLSRYYQHPSYAELSPGQYTDDTQRAIANAKVMLTWHPDDLFDPWAYAKSYLDTYKADPREGYSRRFQEFLKSVDTPLGFLRGVKRTAVSNGSLMGVAPLGFITDLQDLKYAALIQATTTHHQDTVIHAQLVAMAVYYFLQGGQTKNLRSWLMNNADWKDHTDDAYRWSYLVDLHGKGGKTTIKASSISSYMVYALENNFTLQEIMLNSVERGGDTDSAAATSVAVASVCPEIKNDIPQYLIDALEPGSQFGAGYLTDLERQLRVRYMLSR